MDELVTTVTKFKAKQENHLIEALRNFDNSSSKSWQIPLGDNDAAINTERENPQKMLY